MSHLSILANFYYDAACLYEDEDLDPDDSLRVIQRAFASSDCDDLAWLLHEATGWHGIRASWLIPGHGFGHHSLVISPDGRLLDVMGWTNRDALKERYCPEARINLIEWSPIPQTGDILDTLGDKDGLAGMILRGILELPYPPFNQPWFQAHIQPIANGTTRLHADRPASRMTLPPRA